MMQHRQWGRLALAAILAAVAACDRGRMEERDMPADARATMGSAEYTVVLRSHWTAVNFPFEYPAANAVTGPHFSGVIGASHGAGYVLFAEGSTPTPGLERLSEEGKHDPLDIEIRVAQSAGNVLALFESGPLRDFADSVVTTVRVDSAHPLVSLVAMIAPSPDWFTGVANVDLMDGGTWVSSRTVSLLAYDSGGDDGTTYKARDVNTDPKKPTVRATTQHFAPGGSAQPVATVTFTRR